MLVAELPAPVLITRSGALQNMAERLVQEPVVAVDTESNSLHAYREQVCLLQFSTLQVDYLVDPLALRDLSPLLDRADFPAPRWRSSLDRTT